MNRAICPSCGFHNEPEEAACAACGAVLTPDSPAHAGGPDAGADPRAQTQLVPSVVACWNCGAANEQPRTFCQACGQQLKSATREWAAAAPAEVPAAPVATVPSPSPGRRQRLGRSLGGLLPVAIAAALGALFVAGAFVVAGIIGRDAPITTGGDRPDASAASAAAEPAGATSPATGTSGPAGSDASCEAQTLSAPEPGRWTVTRARWGQRSRFDYISFQLRRGGSADETASVTAELVAPADVEPRFGFSPPAGDVALVVTFAGPTGLSGPFGRTANQRALREFRLVRDEGLVHAVIGVAGRGCFELTAPDWQDGAAPGSTNVTLEIARD